MPSSSHSETTVEEAAEAMAVEVTEVKSWRKRRREAARRRPWVVGGGATASEAIALQPTTHGAF